MGSADTRISVRNPSSVSWQVHGGMQPGKAVAMVLETSSHERSPFSHASCGGRWHFLPLSDAVRAMHRMLGTGVQGSNGGCYSAAISLISSMLSNHRMSRSAAVENNIRGRTHVGSLMADDRARSRRATTLNAKSTPNFLNSSGVSGSGRSPSVRDHAIRRCCTCGRAKVVPDSPRPSGTLEPSSGPTASPI